VRRLAVSVVAVLLVIAAEVAATLSATAPHGPKLTRPAPARVLAPPTPHAGEPQLPRDARSASGPRAAADAFVRDYSLWTDRRLAAIPAEDATHRVIRLLARQPRGNRPISSDAVDSVRIAPAAQATYIVTSTIGNFLVGKRGSRWIVVSLPGD
jgi:hypothetical protein